MLEGLIDLEEKRLQALVIEPTRELALQVAQECERLASNLAVDVPRSMEAQISNLRSEPYKKVPSSSVGPPVASWII